MGGSVQLSERIGRELSRKYHFHMSKGETNKWYMQLVRTKQLAPSFIIDSITKNKSVRSRCAPAHPETRAKARLDLEVCTGWASPSSRGLWGGGALLLSTGAAGN